MRVRKPCKVCGSTHFGSLELPDRTWMRTCHGYTKTVERGIQQCPVRWHESYDEHYFEPEIDEPRLPGGVAKLGRSLNESRD